MTEEEEPRNLVDICNEDPFAFTISDTSDILYCTLGMTKPIMCPYQDKEKDHNDMYQCVNPLYKIDEYTMTEQ